MPLGTTVAVLGGLAATAAFAQPLPGPDALLVEQCSEASIDLVANDADQGNAPPLRLLSIASGSLGTASLAGPSAVLYKAGKETGTETLIYIVTNAKGETAPGTLVVTIKPGDGCS